MVHVWIWMCYCLLGVPCTMTRSVTFAYSSAIHTHNGDGTWHMAHGSVLILMLIEYMNRCRVGFWRTERTLVLVHVWIWMCHYCFGIRCTMTPSQLHARLLFNYNGIDVRLCADVDVDWIHMERYRVGFGWAAVVVSVRWYWQIFEFECVIT